ncbi:MAG TPA: hypothetical protein VMB03_30220 [Bryobacteraceae bacterium]|nr:hypothetical protein [Bryobacteraceae bacterium]
MNFRLGSLLLVLTLPAALAGDGIPPRGSAEDYTAHEVSGKMAIGAAYVTPAQARKIFGEDLDKRGYVIFEVGMFPSGDTEVDISPDDFKLRQGPDSAVTRAATPHMVASDAHPQPSPDNADVPSKVHVYTADTIGVVHGPYGQRGVYTDTSATVTNYPPPQSRPAPGASAGANNERLEQSIDDKSLPDIKTKRAVAGYVFFPKPSKDKHADFELIYFGMDGQVSLKLSPPAK